MLTVVSFAALALAASGDVPATYELNSAIYESNDAVVTQVADQGIVRRPHYRSHWGGFAYGYPGACSAVIFPRSPACPPIWGYYFSY
jgi:hypothetical protein